MRLCVILKRGHGKYREKYSTRSITDNEKNSRVCRVLVKSSGRIPRLHVNMAELLRERKFTVHFFFPPPSFSAYISFRAGTKFFIYHP